MYSIADSFDYFSPSMLTRIPLFYYSIGYISIDNTPSALVVTSGLLDARPHCDDKQPMDKSSRFTSETVAFATQLRDLHVPTNAIGPRRSLLEAIYYRS